MKLTQHGTFKNFFLPAGNENFFVFSTNTADADFDFAKAFTTYAFNFIVVFYKDDNLLINEALRQKLQPAATARGIFWIDQLAVSNINKAPGISFSGVNQTADFLNIVFGGDIHGNRLILRSDGGSTVAFNSTDSTLEFTVNGTNRYKMLTGAGQENEFVKYVIPLKHQPQLFGKNTKAGANNIGSLCFQAIHTRSGSIQPTTALLSSTKQISNAIHSFQYFTEESYKTNTDILAVINPCFPENFTNARASKFHSFLELFIRGEISTNILDERGNNFQAKLGSQQASLVSRLAFVNPNGTTPTKRNFFFIPEHGQSLELAAAGEHMLLGSSGTERQVKTKLVFAEYEDVLFKENSDGSVGISGYADSVTSIATNPQGVAVPTKYYIDSEKKSLFQNDGRQTSNQANSVEIDYKAIELGAVKVNSKAPFIPTLSFKPGSNLVDLEKLLVRYRLGQYVQKGGNARVFDNESFVTPQGFVRDGQKLSFIRPDNAKSVQFDVMNVSMTSDFNLSMSKEDVFLVLKPSIVKNPQTFNVTFSVRGFTINLLEFNGKPIKRDDTYILFKFSRHSFAELLDDPAKWSNYGVYKPSPGDAAALANEIKEKIKFPKNDDYKYFNDTILSDPNWNGVVMLNVSIGTGENLPPVFNGLAGSQNLEQNNDQAPPGDRLKLKTGMKFQYMAFTLNKTQINGGLIEVGPTSFYGILDYDVLNKPDGSLSDDYPVVSKHFPEKKTDVKDYKFVLTKLLVRFENSAIKNFQSFAFLQLPQIFDNKVEFGTLQLAHPRSNGPDSKANLVRLEGQYQKNSAGNDEFNFFAQAKININFEEDCILKQISVSRLGFSYSPGTDEFRFDINAGADLGSWSKTDFLSIKELAFENIGFKFKLDKIKLPVLTFDLSKLLVFPKIDFNGQGFLSSFPIKFSHFQAFKFKMEMFGGKLGFDFVNGDFDFFKLPNFETGDPKNGLQIGEIGNLFSFVFDFDLGSLGNLEALKMLKGKLLIGWSMKGGFLIGFKLDSPSSDGLHLNLFGALKIDIAQVDFGKFKPPGSQNCSAFFLRLNDARLTIFGKQLPGDKNVFNGIIISDFSHSKQNIAWLINYDNQETGALVLGAGQHMGPAIDASVTSTVDAIEKTKSTFENKLKGIDGCSDPNFLDKINFRPERNWLIASEAILPQDWPVDLKFIFNDPVLYGIYIGLKGQFLKGFTIDILYKKLADNLGVYSTDIQLPDSIRSMELGGAFIRLPNIGIGIFTNGDWKVDVGFPKNGNDWSRSGFIQLRTTPPFVGFFGMYLMSSKIASLTLFNGFIKNDYSEKHLRIIQAGFAMRVGIGFYFDKGILYVGASITVYGILEGAFAFERQKGLSMLFPDHFAMLGRVGALAELVGYVDFAIIKASVYISLRAEFGMLLVYIGMEGVPGKNTGKGIQPVKMYVEGEVRVEVSIEIGCIEISLRFRMFLRFEYTIGGDGSGNSLNGFRGLQLPSTFAGLLSAVIPISIKGITKIPMVYIPGFSKVRDGNTEQLVMLHSFMIPFFGKEMDGDKIKFPTTNLFKDRIIKPFFEELIAQLKSNGIDDYNKYETLRSVLLNGHCNAAGRTEPIKVNISIDGYVPTFINGINSADKATVDKVLKNFFGFTDSELKPGGANDSIRSAYGKEMLVIPAPISKKIQILNADTTVIHDAPRGFTLTVDGLVNDENGNSSVVTPVDAVTDYNDATLEWMEQFYDGYKTQFINRKQQQNKFALTNKDLREEVIIPEFFRLAALLVLEACYVAKNESQKNDKPFNPEISILADGQFSLANGKWNPNEAIEEVIGQLNYFYNSGLRLPFEAANDSTKAIYEILKQRVPVSYKSDAVSHLSDIKVSIDNKDITSDIFANDDAKRDMLRFVEGFQTNFSLDKLRDEFPATQAIQFTLPFDLVPVTLVVQNNHLGQKDKFRFLEIPAKLAQHGVPGSLYAYELNYAKYDKQVNGQDQVVMSSNRPGVPKLSMLRCLNFEIKVRKHTDKVLEIIGVYAKDLSLADALFNDSYSIDAIDLYYKPEVDPSNAVTTIELDKIIDTFTTILKTNLSPRTSPPLFEQDIVGFLKKTLETGKEYWDDSNSPDRKNFVRLVWEALTTNSGGYYFILDKEVKFPTDASGKELTTGTVILSLYGDQARVPAYFNHLKLSGDQQFFAGLDDRTHYLYVDSIRLTHGTIADKEVLEYHPRMPAHTMGFEVERKRSEKMKPNYRNYIPLEFVLRESDGAVKLSPNKVLPLMPLSENKQDLRYPHLTPLVIQDKNSDPLGTNIDRYSAVGKKYFVGVNVRDVFGGRTSKPDTFLASADYTHCYFDKLVPVDAWPLIHFSYWFKDSAANTLSFEVSCNCEISEVLDMAGITRKPNGDPAYAPGDVIDGHNQDEQLTHVDRLKKLIPGLLTNLYTIVAQLNDAKTMAVINGIEMPDQKDEWRKKVSDLVEKLTGIITPRADGKYHMAQPVRDTPPFAVTMAPAGKLKYELAIEAGLWRQGNFINEANDSTYKMKPGGPSLKDLKAPYVWDYEIISRTTSRINLLNPANLKQSKLKDLDVEIRKKTQNAFCLGISSESRQHTNPGQQLSAKVIYLINQGLLSGIKVENVNDRKEIDEKCYFGIAPVRNKLWSGEYKPTVNLVSESFANIDLDKSLRLVLDKIEQLLQAKKISKEINCIGAGTSDVKELFNQLVLAKRKLVETKLQEQLAWAMDDFGKPLPGSGLTKEFRDLLFARLNNYYAYDGVIKTSVSGVEALGDHRLSISLNIPKGNVQNAQYNLLGSKVSAASKEWYIFFDQKENVVDRVNFELQPAITHIEYDIRESAGSEIQRSTWIQLIEPVPMADDRYFVTNWPKITREFPARPVITKHTSEQVLPDDPQSVQDWDAAKVGLWNYQLAVKDAYVLDDIVHTALVIETTGHVAALAAKTSFEGFIAYWSSKIVATEQDVANGFDVYWKDFVQDLSTLLGTSAFSAKSAVEKLKQYSFDLRRLINEWSIENKSEPTLKVEFPRDNNGNPVKTAPAVVVGPFNIFDQNERVTTILPKVKVFRNAAVKNDVFRYETETIEADSPAMPHIKFFTPLAVKSGESFEAKVFGTAAQPVIPVDSSFKATAKYLIDIAGRDAQGVNRFPKEVRTLPVIPLRQVECKDGARPSVTDELFKLYDKKNGFAAFSLTVYGDPKLPDNLPVFYADNIFKLKDDTFQAVPAHESTSVEVIDQMLSVAHRMDLSSLLKTFSVAMREVVLPLGNCPEIREITTTNTTLNDLPYSITRAYDLDVNTALSLNIPVLGSVTGGTDRRILVLERAAYRVERGTDQPKIEVQVGYAIRLCLTVNKKKFDGKLTLPFVTAAAELGQIEAEWLLQVAGLAGPKIDAVALAPTELNLETFVLAKQSLEQLINSVRDTSTVLIPVPIAISKAPSP